MKRLDVLKHEKEHLARQVEMEEEMITNKLQKKLEKVKQEKVNLENLLEVEQEYIVNKLQKQLSTVAEEKRELETQLRDSTGTILQTLQVHLERWRQHSAPVLHDEPASVSAATASTSSSPGSALDGTLVPESDEVQRTHVLVEHLAHEIDALGEQQERYRRQCEEHHDENELLREELARLQVSAPSLKLSTASAYMHLCIAPPAHLLHLKMFCAFCADRQLWLATPHCAGARDPRGGSRRDGATRDGARSRFRARVQLRLDAHFVRC